MVNWDDEDAEGEMDFSVNPLSPVITPATKTVMITGLPADTEEEDLHEFLTEAGETVVDKVSLKPPNPDGSLTAFVTFASPDDVKSALGLSGIEFIDSEITISIYTPKPAPVQPRPASNRPNPAARGPPARGPPARRPLGNVQRSSYGTGQPQRPIPGGNNSFQRAPPPQKRPRSLRPPPITNDGTGGGSSLPYGQPPQQHFRQPPQDQYPQSSPQQRGGAAYGGGFGRPQRRDEAGMRPEQALPNRGGIRQQPRTGFGRPSAQSRRDVRAAPGPEQRTGGSFRGMPRGSPLSAQQDNSTGRNSPVEFGGASRPKVVVNRNAIREMDEDGFEQSKTNRRIKKERRKQERRENKKRRPMMGGFMDRSMGQGQMMRGGDDYGDQDRYDERMMNQDGPMAMNDRPGSREANDGGYGEQREQPRSGLRDMRDNMGGSGFDRFGGGNRGNVGFNRRSNNPKPRQAKKKPGKSQETTKKKTSLANRFGALLLDGDED